MTQLQGIDFETTMTLDISQKRRSGTGSRGRVSSFTYMYQFAVLGASRVGKSALVQRWLEETFVETHIETVDESYQFSVQSNGVRVPVQVVDTGGSHCFPAMRSRLARAAHGFLFVFDAHDRNSFNRIKELRQEIEQLRCTRPGQPTEDTRNLVSTSMPAVLVANKTDGDNTTDSLNLRLEARQLAEQLGCDYVETSAKHDHGVNEAFRCLMARVEKTYSLDLFRSTKTLSNRRSRKKSAKKWWSTLRKIFK